MTDTTYGFRSRFPAARLLVAAGVLSAVLATRFQTEAIAPAAAIGHGAPPAPEAAANDLADEPAAAVPLGPELPPRVDVTLHDVNTRQDVTLSLPADGYLEPALAAEMARFFRCRRTGRTQPMAPGTLAIIADLAQRYRGRVIEIVSAYRATGQSRTSAHRHGRAIDLRVRGVSARQVRDYLWRRHREVGVGYYHQQGFVHIDHRPGQPDIAWTQPRYDAAYRYHPGWATRARRDR